jgi:hypothetical protein
MKTENDTTKPENMNQTNEAPAGCIERLVRLPSVERGCNGKTNLGRSYAKQADKLAAKHGKKYGVYRCPHCGGTHLTTKLDKSEVYAPLIHISEPNAERMHR